MISRRLIFLFSILVGIGAYAAFFVVAPSISMLYSPEQDQYMAKRFKVQLNPETVQPQMPEETPDLASRPGSVADLLDRSTETLGLPDADAAEIPQFDERLNSDTPERQHDFQQDVQHLRRVDARILEISQDTARKDIQVARRLVRPSSDRLLEPNELPAIRAAMSPDEEGPLKFQPPRKSLLPPGTGIGGGTGDGVQRPKYEEGVVDVKPAEDETPPPVVAMVERKPIEREISKVREEGRESFTFIDDTVDIQIDAFTMAGDEQGFFRLRINPKADAAVEALPKDVTFVVDASGSIGDRKLGVTVRGISNAIAQLKPQDRFNIAAFRGSGKRFRDEQVFATEENKKAAVAFLKGLKALGETDVYKGILPELQQEHRPGVPGVLVVVTDGRPTAGVRDGRTIINGLTDDNDLYNTVYTFGGGRTVNRQLLELLAYRNKGATEVTGRIDDIDEALPEFFDTLSDPLLVDLNADYGRGVAQEDVFPQVLPDFYRDRAVTIYGRFDSAEDKDFVMRLTGLAADKDKELIFKAKLSEAETGDESIAKNWAFQKAHHIIGDISRQGEKPELLAQLRELREKYGVRTSYDE
jgi:Mg-chelatase subunit ChlD